MAMWVERIGHAALEWAGQAGLPVEISPLAAGAAALALTAAFAILVLTGLLAGLRKRPAAETAAALPPQSHPEAALIEARQRPSEAVTAPLQDAPSPAKSAPAPPPSPTSPPQLPPEAILRPFISYSRKDADFAEAVVAALEARGHAPIIDRKDIVPNEPWQERLGELILQSDAVVFLLSPNWLQSEVCRWELRCAEDHGKLFAPVQFGALDISAVPQQLSRRNFVNCQSGWPVNETNQSEFDRAIDRLIKGLQITKELWRREHSKWMARTDAWRAAGMPEDRVLSTGETADIQKWVSEKPVDEQALPDLLLQLVNASVAYNSRLFGDLEVIDGFADLAPDHVRRLPTALVVADYGIIPYDDSRGLLADALAWAKDQALTAPAGRLYAAAGGYGKTRLALQTIATLKAEGWRAGLLPRQALEKANIRGEQDADERLARFFAGRGEKGAFLALDYSEGRTSHIERVTRAALAAPKGGPIRIMLLARGAGEWWNGLVDAHRDIERVFDRKAFEAIGGDIAPEDRPAFFKRAAAAFAQRLGQAQAADDVLLRADWQSAPLPEKRLSAPEVGSPLSLAFEAFLHVRGVALEGSPLAEMAREERRQWARALKRTASDVNAFSDPRLEALHRCAAVVTLNGGFGPAAADAVDAWVRQTLGTALKRAPSLGEDDIARAEVLAAVRSGLENLYRSRRKDGDALSPILPDLLGERLVAEAIARRPGLVGDVLDAGDERGAQSAFTVLNRISRLTVEIGTDAPPVHDQGLVEATQSEVQAALAGPRLAALADPLVAAMAAENGRVHVPALAALQASPPDTRDETSRALLRAQRRLMDINAVPARLRALFGEAAKGAEQNAAPPPQSLDKDGALRHQRALEADARATALSQAGDRQGALAAAQEAVALYRALARENPQAFTPDLAASVSNLAGRLSEVGDRPAALVAAQEAAALYRTLAIETDQALAPSLAASLLVLASSLSGSGDQKGALAAAEEATALFRALAKDNPESFTHSVATSVSNSAGYMSQAGDRSGALAAAQEAVALRRALAKENPQAFTPDLASSLSNMATLLSQAGDRPGAVAAAQESVVLTRALAKENPQAFTPDLASSILTLAGMLSKADDQKGAVEAAREATGLYRALAKDDPKAFTPDLARSVSDMAIILSEFGDRQGALVAAQEALALRRVLAKENPQAFTPDLASSTENLANRLLEANDLKGALAAAKEARALYRSLATANRQRFKPELARFTENYSTMLSLTNDRQGALGAAQEATDLFQDLAKDNPEAFTADLARSLSGLAIRLSHCGNRHGALIANQKATAHYRALAEDNRQAFMPDLASSLATLAGRFSETGDRLGALAPAQEAITLYRALAEENPKAFTPDLAVSLGVFGQALLIGRKAVDARLAMEAFLEAATLMKPLRDAKAEAFGAMFQELIREYVRAAYTARAKSAEINHALQALGASLNG